MPIKKEDIYLKSTVVNQFTPDNTELRLMSEPLKLTPKLDEYFRVKIEKATSDKANVGELDAGNPILRYIDKEPVKSATEISKLWRNKFVASDDQKVNELIFLRFSVSGVEHFAFMRIILDEQLTHGTNKNHPLETTFNNLPSASKPPIDSIVINLDTREYWLLEKAIKVGGAKVNYFSKGLLEIVPEQSPNLVLKNIEKLAQGIADDFIMDNVDFETKMKSTMYESLENDELSVEKIADGVFGDNKTAKDMFVTEAANTIPEKMIVGDFDKETHIKKYQTQKLKFGDFELKIPTEAFGDKNQVEIIENPDGSRNILFKNIKNIEVK
ncbi:nucleoid-associated protein [Streptococcus agalactiae]